MKNLKEHLKMGLVLKILELKSKQSRWLKPFIDSNSKLRADAKSDFEKGFI